MASALAMAACGPKQQVATVPAIDLANLDTTVSPAVDFYQYSTGGWQKNNPLKPEYARFGSFDQLRENNVKRLNDLFAEMGTLKTEKGTVEQKISDLYKQGLDSTRLNAEGAAPLKKYVDEIYAAADKDALVKIIAGLHNVSESSFFGAYVMSDLADSDNQILYLGQGGLGIGDRDYYVEAENAAIKEGYRNFLAKVFSLTGVAEPEKAAANALAVEDVLATNSWTSVQERNIQAQYNPCSTEELIKNYPGFDWKLYFETRGIADQQKLIVSEPSFFKAFCEYFGGADLAVLKDYVAGQLIQGATGSLSDDFYTASFDFFSTQMSGIKEQKPRWKRAMQAPNGILGEAVGKMYVAKYFPESSKTKMLDLVDNLKKAFSQHIDELDWMSDSTKTKATRNWTTSQLRSAILTNGRITRPLTSTLRRATTRTSAPPVPGTQPTTCPSLASRPTRPNGECLLRQSTPTITLRRTRSASLRRSSSLRSSTLTLTTPSTTAESES